MTPEEVDAVLRFTARMNANESPPNKRGRFPWVIWCWVRAFFFGNFWPSLDRGHAWRVVRENGAKRVGPRNMLSITYGRDCVCDRCDSRIYRSGFPVSAIDQLGDLVE